MATRNITFKKTNIGGSPGPFDILTASPPALIATGVTKVQLEAGYIVNNIDTVHVNFTVNSTGVCTNSVSVNIPYTPVYPPYGTFAYNDCIPTNCLEGVVNVAVACYHDGVGGYYCDSPPDYSSTPCNEIDQCN